MSALSSGAWRVGIIALGVNSSDDLKPLIFLARGLAQSGAHVTLITHGQYAKLLASEGVQFLDGGPCPFVARSQTPEGRALDSPGAGSSALTAFMLMLTGEWFTRGKAAAADLDMMVLATTSAGFIYPSVCEFLHRKFVVLDCSPCVKTSEFGPPRGYGSSQAGFRWVNSQRWDAHAKSMWVHLYRDGVNRARASHKLPLDERAHGPWEAISDERGLVPVLLAYSDVLLARPLDWSPGVRIVGPLLEEEAPSGTPIPAPVTKLLEGSMPVVYVTFGEQFNTYQSRESRKGILVACAGAIQKAGAAAVVVCPPSCGVSADALRHCLVLAERPPMAVERAIWRKSGAVLCSGDSLTVHAAIMAGAALCTFDFGRDDTPEAFWGARVAASGLGPASVPVKSKDTLGPLLEASLRAVLPSDSPIRTAARAAASSMARPVEEQGLARACALLRDVAGVASPSTSAPAELASTSAAAATAAAPSLSAAAEAPAPTLAPSAVVAAAVEASPVPKESKVASDDKRPIAGFSFSHRGALDTRSEGENVWRKGEDGIFKVRTGPNYKKNGRKQPSGPSLYELVGVDMIKSDSALDGLEAYLRFPHIDRDTNHAAVPSLMVVNGTLPLEAPSMLSSTSDGPTINAVFYFAIKQSTCDALRDLSGAAPAIKLLAAWCASALEAPDMFARFKCIGSVRNYEAAGMPSMFKSFNGKPVLIRNRLVNKGGSGHMRLGTNKTLEMNVNIRAWPYLAKQGFGYLLSGSHKTDLDVGFVLEGIADHELPECLIGSARLTKLDPSQFHKFSPQTKKK